MDLKARICIIDSGINIQHKRIDYKSITKRYQIKDKKCYAIEQDVVIENIGHGTAVCAIILSMLKDVEIYDFKIFYEELNCEKEFLITALQYIYDNVECDIINLSLGINYHNQELYNICYKLYLKDIIIVSAFDNSGAVSFPAAYPFVIGVDGHYECRKKDDFIYVEGSKFINIFAYDKIQRVAWGNPEYAMVEGASYANAYVTAYIANWVNEGINGFESIIEIFRNHINRYIEIKDNYDDFLQQDIFKIKKAIAFPYSKEIDCLLNNKELLNFSLIDIYDHKKMGNLKKQISRKNEYSYIVKNVDDIEWESDFDTLILGHLDELEVYTKEKIKEKMISLCTLYGKNTYSFDNLIEYKNIYTDRINICWPKQYDTFVNNRFGKLYKIEAPVLGIFGTSSKQGKYTLQLVLKKMLLKNGYSVGQIGTEPSALLFNMDYVYHMGYNGSVNISNNESILLLNSMMHEIDKKEVDIIIVGSQSGTIPYFFENVSAFSCNQFGYFLGTYPDAVVLCINPFDAIDYVSDTIYFIEGMLHNKVIALVLFPFDFSNAWAKILSMREKINLEKAVEMCKIFSEKLNKPCFVSGNEEDELKLYNIVINYFEND